MKIIALVAAMAGEEDKKFIQYLESKGYGYWHWIDGAWLITTIGNDSSQITAIRDEIQKIAPGKYSYVFEVDVKPGWAGFGPNSTDKNMFSWIKTEWYK